jgi:hypothetical protein
MVATVAGLGLGVASSLPQLGLPCNQKCQKQLAHS